MVKYKDLGSRPKPIYWAYNKSVFILLLSLYICIWYWNAKHGELKIADDRHLHSCASFFLNETNLRLKSCMQLSVISQLHNVGLDFLPVRCCISLQLTY